MQLDKFINTCKEQSPDELFIVDPKDFIENVKDFEELIKILQNSEQYDIFENFKGWADRVN